MGSASRRTTTNTQRRGRQSRVRAHFGARQTKRREYLLTYCRIRYLPSQHAQGGDMAPQRQFSPCSAPGVLQLPPRLSQPSQRVSRDYRGTVATAKRLLLRSLRLIGQGAPRCRRAARTAPRHSLEVSICAPAPRASPLTCVRAGARLRLWCGLRCRTSTDDGGAASRRRWRRRRRRGRRRR